MNRRKKSLSLPPINRSGSSQYYHDPREGVIKTSYKRLRGPPAKRPLTVCVEIHDNDLDHKTMLASANQRLRDDVTCSVVCIQYVPRNVITGTTSMKDRWLITVNCEMAKLKLLRGLVWEKRIITVRSLDDVLYQEYQAAIKRKMVESQLKWIQN